MLYRDASATSSPDFDAEFKVRTLKVASFISFLHFISFDLDLHCFSAGALLMRFKVAASFCVVFAPVEFPRLDLLAGALTLVLFGLFIMVSFFSLTLLMQHVASSIYDNW